MARSRLLVVLVVVALVAGYYTLPALFAAKPKPPANQDLAVADRLSRELAAHRSGGSLLTNSVSAGSGVGSLYATALIRPVLTAHLDHTPPLDERALRQELDSQADVDPLWSAAYYCRILRDNGSAPRGSLPDRVAQELPGAGLAEAGDDPYNQKAALLVSAEVATCFTSGPAVDLRQRLATVGRWTPELLVRARDAGLSEVVAGVDLAPLRQEYADAACRSWDFVQSPAWVVAEGRRPTAAEHACAEQGAKESQDPLAVYWLHRMASPAAPAAARLWLPSVLPNGLVSARVTQSPNWSPTADAVELYALLGATERVPEWLTNAVESKAGVSDDVPEDVVSRGRGCRSLDRCPQVVTSAVDVLKKQDAPRTLKSAASARAWTQLALTREQFDLPRLPTPVLQIADQDRLSYVWINAFYALAETGRGSLVRRHLKRSEALKVAQGRLEECDLALTRASLALYVTLDGQLGEDDRSSMARSLGQCRENTTDVMFRDGEVGSTISASADGYSIAGYLGVDVAEVVGP